MQPGSPAYAFRGHMMPGPQMVQYQRPNTNGATTDNVPVMQLPYHSGTTLVGIISCILCAKQKRVSKIEITSVEFFIMSDDVSKKFGAKE